MTAHEIRNKLKHCFRFGDTVALIEFTDNKQTEEDRSIFKIKDYSYLGYTGYKEGDEQYQDEIGFVIKANSEKNINEITVWFGENRFVCVPYCCLHLEEQTHKQLQKDPELKEDLIYALARYNMLAAQ